MNPGACIEELRARLRLAEESASLLLAVVETDAAVAEARPLLLALLRATPLVVEDLGACTSDSGPSRWMQRTRASEASAFVLTFVPPDPLSGRAFAGLLNAERELLRGLAGPVVLVVSGGTEKLLRQLAPDFFTWIAQVYPLPGPRQLRALAVGLGVESASDAPASPPEPPIRFLHISDLHLRPQRARRYDQDRVLRGLFEFLGRDRDEFPLDLIFVTGDLAHAARPEEYALAVALLKRLMAITGVAAERVFVVPGNHDVDRESGRWLLRTLARRDEADAFFVGSTSRAFHAQKFAAYQRSMGELLGAGRPLGLAVGADAVEVIEVRGVRLAVASFNSAWFAQGDDDQGKLWVGEPNVEQASDRVADEDAEFAVALLHHPFDYLHEGERDNVERWLERGFDLVLRGHLHADKTRSIASQRGGFVEVAAPAAYQGSPWPNGCFLGEIHARARDVLLRPYMFSAGPDPWVLDTKVFPDDAVDGYRHRFTVPAKRRMKSALARPLRASAEAAVRAASPAQLREIAQEIGLPNETDSSAETAAYARTLADSPALRGLAGPWKHVFDIGADFIGAFSAVNKEIAAQGERVTITDAATFEAALRRVGRVVAAVLTVSRPRPPMGEVTGDNLTDLISKVLSASVRNATPSEVTHRRLDLKILGTGSSSVIAVVVIEGRMTRTASKGDLQRLDACLSDSGARFGALIMVGDVDATEPVLQRAETPAGREVVLMVL